MRIPALDGLRGLAIILVVISHTHLAFPAGGTVGVTLFFVLSGFLITRILIRGSGLKPFYARRARRLLPALIVMVAVTALIYRGDWWGTSWPALFYTSNFATIQNPESMGYLIHTWSLAVEEHFYLLWPLIILVVPARLRIVAIAGLCLLAVGWRAYLIDAGQNLRAQFGSDANAAAILVGSLLAVTKIPKRPMFGLVAIAGLILLAAVPGGINQSTFAHIGLAAIAVHSTPTLLESAWLRWFGTISYGLYLWHLPLLELGGWWMTPVAVLVAWVSWKLIEQPILQVAPPTQYHSELSRVSNPELHKSRGHHEP